MNYQLQILPNGLRIVHLQIPGAKVGHFGMAIGAGSLNESNFDEYGLAHFVEHTIFKGTAKRRSWHILNRMESVGGEINAFTTKADTVLYTTFPKGSLTRAVELVTDLILNSRFPATEIDKEREVICDEINSYLDSPSEAVYDDFEDLLFEGSPLGHNILGTVESVRGITGDMCRHWLDRFYRAGNMVAFYAGPYGLDSFIKKTEKYLSLFSSETVATPSVIASNKNPFKIVREREIHQAHTVTGCFLADLDTRRRTTLSLLTNILGGPGMNSLFNLSLRERRGLVYSVESSLSTWRDITMFTTYYGCDPGDNDKCLKLINEQINGLADTPMSSRQLTSAKKQYRGQLLLARENVENRIIAIARSVLMYGQAYTTAEIDRLVDSISPDEVRAMAQLIASQSTLSFTPA